MFFVDEIHRLSRTLEETFYPAMEDHRLPITVGQGAGARVVTLELPPFTLVGATTRTGLLTTPLRDRFGIQARLEPYAVRGAREHRAPLGRDPRDRPRGRRRGRDRGAQPRYAARGEPAAQAGQGLRRGPYGGCRDGRCGRGGAGAAGGRRARPGPAGPRDPARDLREVRRRPGRALDAGGGGGGGAGHDRGRLRALPADAGADQAHAARAGRDAGRVRTSGNPARPRARRPRSRRRSSGPALF